MVFFFGSSGSSRRSATVTSSHPEVSSAATIDPSLGSLPVPMNSRERSSTPAPTSGAAERSDQIAAKAGLLADLTQGAVLGAFVGLNLAFRKRPVVVGGAVDNRDFGLARPGASKHDTASSSNDAHFRNFENLCCHRCSFVS